MAWTDGPWETVSDELREPFGRQLPAGGSAGLSLPSIDWLVVDWYNATDELLRTWRKVAPASTRLLVIDDEARRTLDAADLVVNSRLGLERSPYAGGATALLGERYALLRSGLRNPRPIASPFAPELMPVLITLGGTDPGGLASEVLRALAGTDARAFAPVLVQGAGTAPDLAPLLEEFPASQVLLRIDAAALAGWSAVCRFAVSACGGTLYELAWLGLPFVGIIAAANQRAFAAEASARWRMPVIDFLDATRDEARTTLRQVLARFCRTDAAPRSKYGDVDGLGTARVADAMGLLRGSQRSRSSVR